MFPRLSTLLAGLAGATSLIALVACATPSGSPPPTPVLQVTAAPTVGRTVVITSGTAVPAQREVSPSTTPSPAPTSTAEPGSVRRVTLADAGQTIALKVGERFLLALGEGYEWSVRVDDQSIVSRVPNVTVVRGAQGLYQARKPGETTLHASGDPACRKSTPPCAMPSRDFRVQIVVQ